MSTTKELVPEMKMQVVEDYLGFRVESIGGIYLAHPLGWDGEELWASSRPKVRKAIWKWWHQVS